MYKNEIKHMDIEYLIIQQGYRMVFASVCEHASSAFIFASTSSDQFSDASSEHFKNYKWRAATTVNFSPAEISLN